MQQLSTLRSLVASLLLACTLLALLAGCGMLETPAPDAPLTATVPPPTATTAPTPTPDPLGGNLTLRLAAEIPELRPWQPRSRGEEQLIGLMYSGLMRLDNRLRPQPDLAERWEASTDGRALTFTLRTGLVWHDGDPLDADDVLFTLEQLRTLPVTSTALLSDLRFIAAVGAPTSNTVVLSLTERYAPLLAELALPILPSHLLADRDVGRLNFWDVPIGSGPFQLDVRTPEQAIVLRRFAQFHRGAPLLERVALVHAPDLDVTLQALADTNLLLAELPWETTSQVADLDIPLQVGSYPENGFYYLAFNLREDRPFADANVRRALALAVDVPRLVEAVTQGRGIAVASSAAPGSWADLTPPPESNTDLVQARALLDEAGWELPPAATIRQRDGVPFNAALFVRGDDERRVQAARRLAEAASSIGLSLTVELADFASVLLPKYAPPYDFDLLLGSWLKGAGDPGFGDYMYYDPDDFQLFHSSQINQGPGDPRITRNIIGFSDANYDNQASAARQRYNLDERRESYEQTQARLDSALPYLFLWADRMPVVLHERVQLDPEAGPDAGTIDLSSPLYLWNIEHWYVADTP